MITFLFYFFLFSFFLNFLWEMTQIPLYLSRALGDYSDIRRAIKIRWRVSIFDAITILVAYSLVSIILQDMYWVYSWNIGWIIFVGGLLVWQISVEYVSVYTLHRWAYASGMPQIFGIGLSPLLQMMILPVFAILLAR